MKASEFRKFYLSFVNLYGVIDSDESFKIIKRWYPNLKKADYLKDLKDRSFKMTRNYFVRKINRRNSYIIQNEMMDDEMIDFIFMNMRGKEYFVTDDLDSYLNIGKNGIILENSAHRLMDSFVKRGYSRDKAEIATYLLYEKVRWSMNPMDPIKRIAENIEFDSEEDVRDFFDSFMEFMNDVRLFTNGGFTPAEMRAKCGPVSLDDVMIDLGPNIVEHLMDCNDNEIAEMIAAIEASAMPIKAKNSMIEQIRNIIKRKKIMA